MRISPLLTILLVATAPAFGGGVTPVDRSFCADMKNHHVISANSPIGCDRLAVVTFSYVDFSGAEHDDGKIVVMDAVAPQVQRIFDELHVRHFPIAKAQPVNAYEGDDEASMADNNTSAFNDRVIPDTNRISLHAYGVAIDLNPVQNPFITRNGAVFTVHPSAAAAYLNRRQQRPGKADRPGLSEAVIEVFARNGFTEWGGNWDDPIDYQHFDIGRPLAEELAKLSPFDAKRRFEQVVKCRVVQCGADAKDPTVSVSR